jgi:hypothetical protein
MNYKRIHDQIIQLAQLANRKKGNQIYYERHHIIPKCMGGNDDIENLVLLTGREHFIIHKLLCEIYPDNLKLKHAIWAMCNQKTGNINRTYTVSNRDYEMSKNNLKHSDETKQKMRESKLGKKRNPFTERHRQNIGLASKNRIPWNAGVTGYKLHTFESKEKIRNANLGKVISKSTRKKMQAAQLGKSKKCWSKIYKEVTTNKQGHLSELCKYFNLKPHCIIDNIKRSNPRKPDGLKFIMIG